MNADDATPAEFCAVARSLTGERAEAYVGSADHLCDVERLLAYAPAGIRGPLETFRDFLASGEIITADPDSNVTSRWPSEVQAAVAAVQDYIARNC